MAIALLREAGTRYALARLAPHGSLPHVMKIPLVSMLSDIERFTWRSLSHRIANIYPSLSRRTWDSVA